MDASLIPALIQAFCVDERPPPSLPALDSATTLNRFESFDTSLVVVSSLQQATARQIKKHAVVRTHSTHIRQEESAHDLLCFVLAKTAWHLHRGWSSFFQHPSETFTCSNYHCPGNGLCTVICCGVLSIIWNRQNLGFGCTALRLSRALLAARRASCAAWAAATSRRVLPCSVFRRSP